MRIKYIYYLDRRTALQSNIISSHSGPSISEKTSSAIAGISLSPRARSCKMTKSKNIKIAWTGEVPVAVPATPALCKRKSHFL